MLFYYYSYRKYFKDISPSVPPHTHKHTHTRIHTHARTHTHTHPYPYPHTQHLHRMHNFCTLLSVLNGLAHPAITRLKKSFSKMDKFSVKKLEELQSLARPGDNFRILRDELKKASNPCIPYL